MKDLVYILPDKDAGVASVVRNLLKFKSSGYHTSVVFIHNTQDDPTRRINTNFNADKTLRIAYNPKLNSRIGVLKKIAKCLSHNSVLIANDGHLDLDVFRYLNIELPTVYIMHGDNRHYFNAIMGKRHLMGRIITVSDYLKQEVHTLFEKSKLDNSNLNVESIKFPVPKPIINLENRSVSDEIRLVFVGSLIEAKGVNDLRVIIDDLEEIQVKYTLNIIGNGKEDAFLKNQFKNNVHIHFFGHLSNAEVIESHLYHDVLLLPSKGEGLPVVIVEAMKCGVIPMATNLKSGIPELIEDGITGFTVDLNETHKYAEYISELNDNRERMVSMKALNIDKANRMFDPVLQARAYERAFNDALPIKSRTTIIKKIMARLPMYMEHRLVKLIS